MAVFSVPEVGAEDESVLEVTGVGIGCTLDGVTMKNGEKVDELRPVAFEGAAVGAEWFAFCAKGDFFEAVRAVPVEVEVAVKAANGLSGAEGAIQPNASDHDFGEGAFNSFAREKFFNDLGVRVAKF